MRLQHTFGMHYYYVHTNYSHYEDLPPPPPLRDHAGGNVLLKRQYPDLQVYGGANENVAAQTQ